MLKLWFVALVGAPILIGCARSTAILVVSPEHPASPEAAEAPLSEPSDALAVVDPVRAEPLPPSGHDHVGPGTNDPVLGPEERTAEEASPHEGHAGHAGHAGMDHDGAEAPAAPAEAPLGAIPQDDDHAHGAHGGQEPATAPAAARPLYVCPMHPQVTSNLPGQRCPKCRMKLVERDDRRNR